MLFGISVLFGNSMDRHKVQLFLEAGKKNDININILKDNRQLRYVNRYEARHYGNI